MLNKKEITTSGLEHYIDYTSSLDLDLVASSSFFSLYKKLLMLSEICVEEIKANYSKLDVDKQNKYLKFVKSEIEYNLKFNNIDKILSPYLKEYDLSINNFPFERNKEVKQILSVDFSEVKDYSSLNVTDIKDMHLNFFKYAIYIETHKILEFIHENLPGVNIFKSKNSKQIFQDLLIFLNIKDHTTRGNQAKLAAIFQTPASFSVIFKASTSKKQYLDFLNSIYGSKFTTKSISNGFKYMQTIEDWISELNQ